MAFPEPLIMDRELKREWHLMQLEENRQRWKAMLLEQPEWKGTLEQKVPPQMRDGMEKAFSKALGLVFEQGTACLGSRDGKEDLSALSRAAESVVLADRGGRTLRALHREVKHASRRTGLITGLEGSALGTLGIGLPDILIFLGILHKGGRETAMRYGFSCEGRGEQVLLLKMMETALSTGGRWNQLNSEINELLGELNLIETEQEYQAQLARTASALTMDMLIQKFIQGVPLVGGLAGAANSLYYGKIMAYVRLKYRRRYLYRLCVKKGRVK